MGGGCPRKSHFASYHRVPQLSIMSFTFQRIRSERTRSGRSPKAAPTDLGRVGLGSLRSDVGHSLAPTILVRVSQYEWVFNTYESQAGCGGAGALGGFSSDCTAANAGAESCGRPVVAGQGCVGHVDPVRSVCGCFCHSPGAALDGLRLAGKILLRSLCDERGFRPAADRGRRRCLSCRSFYKGVLADERGSRRVADRAAALPSGHRGASCYIWLRQRRIRRMVPW